MATQPDTFPTGTPTAGRVTHAVENQPPPLEDVNLYAHDLPLREAVAREGGAFAEDRLRAYGQIAGSRRYQEHARLANAFPPVLQTHDRYGHRLDEVEFHPSYHALMDVAVRHEVHAFAWTAKAPGAHVARGALAYLHNQLEAGTACPLTMTHAVVPSLRHAPAVAHAWIPRVLSDRYDGTLRPAEAKPGVTFGMAMTEKQGGSDVRSNTTRAEPLAADDEALLHGHKWFCSAPMCDAFLTLAYTPGGRAPTCYLVPRFRPDGTRNNFYIQRLKAKIGNRSNASSEIEYQDTWAVRVGDVDRGVPTIIEMVHHTRLDVALGAAGLMRQALTQALHHAAHRRAFGRLLLRQPLMQNVLADLALESEAATALAFRVARSFDQADSDAHEAGISRIVTAVAKYWLAKRVTGHVTECLECHGGNGYVEDGPMGRLYREAPLGSIWEGSGNVQCLDVLRAMQRAPDAVAAVVAELRRARGADARLDRHVDAVVDALRPGPDLEPRARHLVERLALALQGALLVQHAPPAVADAFCASRLGGERGLEYGTLPAGVDFDAILARARPPAASTAR